MKKIKPNSKLYLSLGSNLGERAELLKQARQQIEVEVGAILASSSLYETEPYGFQSSHPFLNQAIVVETALEPREILERTSKIERYLGRKQKSKNGVYSDRTCDIDIILYGDRVINDDDIEIPHPRFRERAFVLEPLCEIAADVTDPVSGLSLGQLMEQLWQEY